jgi:hypothetical protein
MQGKAAGAVARLHGAYDGFVGAERITNAERDGRRGGVCEAEPLPLRVPLLVLAAERARGCELKRERGREGVTLAERQAAFPNFRYRIPRPPRSRSLCKCA